MPTSYFTLIIQYNIKDVHFNNKPSHFINNCKGVDRIVLVKTILLHIDHQKQNT
jgi:hypothetical protein